MRIARFTQKEKIGWGVLENDFIRPLKGDPFAEIEIDKHKIPLHKLRLLAAASPSKIILAGLNYKDHAKELDLPLLEEPVIFLKPATTVIGNEDKIYYPFGVKQLDYEAELALVIKRKCKFVKIEHAREYILGYTCLNDVTARDLQKKDGQWTRAKSFDSFCPIGPWIETEINPLNLKIQAILNGNVVQDSNTSNMIFTPEYLVAFISQIMTLYPGDVVSTGTPLGVGPMKPKDKIEIRIQNIGSLVNKVVAAD